MTRWFLFAGRLMLTGVFGFFAAAWLRPMRSFGQRPPEVETAFAGRTNRVLRINNRWTKPRIERAAAAGAPSPQLSRLKRLVTVEVALGVVILGITAALVALAPPIGTHV